LIRHEVNRGICATYQTAFLAATGQYCATLDSDDISLPERLEKQAAFLESHPQVGMVGIYLQPFIHGQEPGQLDIWRTPTQNTLLCWILNFEQSLYYPMFRMDLARVVGGFGSPDQFAQDYSLWSRLFPLAPVAVIPEALLHYRRHGAQHSFDEANQPAVWTYANTVGTQNITKTLGHPVSNNAVWIIQYHPEFQKTTFSDLLEAVAVQWQLYHYYDVREPSIRIRLQLLHKAAFRLLRTTARWVFHHRRAYQGQA
jgi:glycosyltransferase involved in cell wall biosynthesis